jgi:hypothetical protein
MCHLESFSFRGHPELIHLVKLIIIKQNNIAGKNSPGNTAVVLIEAETEDSDV